MIPRTSWNYQHIYLTSNPPSLCRRFTSVVTVGEALCEWDREYLVFLMLLGTSRRVSWSALGSSMRCLRPPARRTRSLGARAPDIEFRFEDSQDLEPRRWGRADERRNAR